MKNIINLYNNITYNIYKNNLPFVKIHQNFLQIFQKIFRSPGDDRPKYFMVQYFFRKIIHGPSHQF